MTEYMKGLDWATGEYPDGTVVVENVGAKRVYGTSFTTSEDFVKRIGWVYFIEEIQALAVYSSDDSGVWYGFGGIPIAGSTVVRDALSPIEGQRYWNTTTDQAEQYVNGNWGTMVENPGDQVPFPEYIIVTGNITAEIGRKYLISAEDVTITLPDPTENEGQVIELHTWMAGTIVKGAMVYGDVEYASIQPQTYTLFEYIASNDKWVVTSNRVTSLPADAISINTNDPDGGLVGDNVQAQLDNAGERIDALEDPTLLAAVTNADSIARQAITKAMYGASGFVNMGKHLNSSPDYVPINEGLWTNPQFSNRLRMGRNGGEGSSASDYPVINVRGTLLNLSGVGIASESENIINFPEAEDGTQTYNSATGESITYADAATAFAYADANANVEVVTNRYDFAAYEVVHELVSEKGIMTVNGQIQNGQTSLNVAGITIPLVRLSDLGIATTYASFFEGDGGYDAYVIDYNSLTAAQKVMAQIHAAGRLYNSPDGLVEVRGRVRTFAGAGNGKWAETDITKGASTLRFVGNSTGYITAQGTSESPTSLPSTSGAEGYYAATRADNWHPEGIEGDYGIFKAMAGADTHSNRGYNGQCYLIPICTVKRLNQGAFHPVYNVLGASLWNRTDVAGGIAWYSDVATQPTSISDCFNFTTALGEVGARTGTGVIGNTSGHPAGLFYDAIYDFQVEDERLDVSGNFTPEQSHKYFGVDRSVNGTNSSRNVEVMPFTRSSSGSAINTGSTYNYDSGIEGISDIYGTRDKMRGSGEGFEFQTALGAEYEDTLGYLVKSDNTIIPCIVYGSTGDFCRYDDDFGTVSNSDVVDVVLSRTTDIPCFTWLDWIADPANFLATNPNGAYGAWIPEIPDGTSKPYPANRKALEAVAEFNSSNNGTSWGTASRDLGTDNAISMTMPTGNVALWTYDYASNFTEDTSQVPVHNNILKAMAMNSAYTTKGAAFVQSLIGKVPTGATNPSILQGFDIRAYELGSDGKFNTNAAYAPQHDTINLAGVDSPAVKVVVIEHTNEYGLVKWYAMFKEMVHDTVDGFGDDDKFDVVNGRAYYTDQNGNTIQVGFAEIKAGYKLFRKPTIATAA